MTLGPDEVQAQTFRQRLRGYDPVEVDAFLDRLAGALREHQQRAERLASERDRAAGRAEDAEQRADRAEERAARAEERAERAEERAERAEELVRSALDRLPREQEVPRARAEEDAETIRRQAREQAAEAHRAARDQIARMVAALQGAASAHQELREALEDLAERSAALADAQHDAVDHDAVRDHLVELVASTEQARQRAAPEAAEPADDGSRGPDAQQPPSGAGSAGEAGAAEQERRRSGNPRGERGVDPTERSSGDVEGGVEGGVERLPVPPLLLSRRRASGQ